MNDDVVTARVPARTLWRDRIVASMVLILGWMLLWGVFSWANLISGIIVAIVVLAVFPLPPVTFAGRPRPPALLRLVWRFVADLVVHDLGLEEPAQRFRCTDNGGHPQFQEQLLRVRLIEDGIDRGIDLIDDCRRHTGGPKQGVTGNHVESWHSALGHRR